MELTQRMDCELFPRPSQRPAGSNKVGFLGIAGATYPVVLGLNKVGRDPTCHVSLDNQTVSRQHAVLNAHSAREVLLMDMGSANGTKLENADLSAYVPCPIKNGDVVQFGDVFGVFRSLSEPAVDDFPATQRCAMSPPPVLNRGPIRIPESPENSDLDDSIICLPKNTSATFKNSTLIADLSKVKNESTHDYSLFEAETQQPEQSANESVVAETQAPPNNDRHIFVAETQVDSPSELSRIFDADTQVPEGPVRDNIHTAETQAPVNDSKIFEAETQVEKPSDDSRIFEAETQVDKCDNSAIFNTESQVTTRDFHEANTQVPDRDIHMAETQVWLGRSPQVTSTPEDNTPEESSQGPELDEVDFAETQIWPENPPVTKLENTRPKRKEDLAETQVWPELGPTEAPINISIENKNRKDSEKQFIDKVAENIAEDPIVNPSLPSPSKLAGNDIENMVEDPIVSPTLPSPSKAKHPPRAPSTKSESSDQEISFTEMEDDFMICQSQTVMEIDQPLIDTDKDKTPYKNIEDLPTQIIPKRINLPSERANETRQNNTFEDMATQVIAENVNEPGISDERPAFEDIATQIIPGDVNEPIKSKADKTSLDFEDMATQIVPGDIEPSKIRLNETRTTVEEMATQVLPDDDDVLTQIIPTANPETSREPDAFEEMLTQVIPEPEPKKDEIVFKIPHASPMKKRKSFNVTPVSSPRKKIEETNEENYYAATQDIMTDLSSQVIPLGYLRRVGSGSSQSSDSQSQSFSGQNCIDDWDLPNSQEIAVNVASNVAAETPVLSTSQSSDSEDEHPLPSILYKAPEKKKRSTENTENTDTARRSGRPRKPTVKARELDMMEIEEYTIVSRKPRSKKIKEENKLPEIEKAKKKETAVKSGDKSRVEFPVNVKIKEEKKSPSETKRRSKTDAKSDSATQQNVEQSTSSGKERKPRCSRRIKQEKESQSDITNEFKEKCKSTSTKDEKITTERTRRHRHTDSSPSVTVSTDRENKKGDSDQKKPERNRRHRYQDISPTVIEITDGESNDSILKVEKKPERTRRHKHKDKDSPSVTLITDLETTDSVRRSKRLKVEEQSPLEISTAYDIDGKPGRKRSHGRDSQEISGVEKKYTCRKRARMEKMQGQHRVCLTSFPPAALPEIKKLLEGLGAVLVEDISSCTVLVSPSLRRTVKLLCCVGLGRPVVGRRWLEACSAAGALLDPWKHILRDEPAEQRFGCSLEATLRGPRGFLTGRRVAATQSVKPPADDLRKIIESSGGTWCEGPAVSWGALCVTSEEDRGQWARLRRKGVELVHVDFVLTGVLRQTADVEHFRLK